MSLKYIIKQLEENDLNPSFFETLSCLVPQINPDLKKAKQIFSSLGDNYKIFIALKDDGTIIGLTTLFIEQKFFQDFTLFGHIEDVVVQKDFQRQGIGSDLVKQATEEAVKVGCSYIRICCADDKIPFYEKLGYKKDGNTLSIELKK